MRGHSHPAVVPHWVSVAIIHEQYGLLACQDCPSQKMLSVAQTSLDSAVPVGMLDESPPF